MAKSTFIVEDTWENGEPTVRGKFSTERTADDKEGMTPNSKLVIEAVRRMWETGALIPLASLVCQDLAFRNRMAQQQMERQAGAAALPPLPPAAPEQPVPPPPAGQAAAPPPPTEPLTSAPPLEPIPPRAA